ncbi:MAG: hypothetical protein BWY72_01319 [Bacteroidetes bacterium ADurb.Bin416]|nr:MAG: hypothetical protein BWY72_01319 [Bacteroidetes bacterium ADurb.Bin416]
MYNHIIPELAIEGHEFQVGLLGPVLLSGTIHKRPPHNHATKGFQGISQHIGSVNMGTSVILWAGLSFAVGFYQKAPEIGY